MAPDGLLVTSAVLLAGLLVFHSVAGERYIVRRLLRRDNLPKLFGADTFTKRTLRYAWHLLTIMGLALVALLAYASVEPVASPILHILAAALGASALWGLAATRATHLSWILLLAIGALVEVRALA